MNCLIAQSGGPTSVINSSLAGVIFENNALKYYKNVYAGLNGIEGILKEKIINLSNISSHDLKVLKYTPASALGSCRYKMKDFNIDDTEYKLFFSILSKLDIKSFFYIGGNDSMDTVSQLSEYSKKHNLDINIIGIPKTIDNDLTSTDHTPGFGSAAKYIATLTLENYFDSCVYTNNGIFILETMGRDTGWLAASACLAQVDNEPVADFIYLPEMPLDIVKFLSDVSQKFKEKNHVFIVVSEGVKDSCGNFLSKKSMSSHDKFGHAQLGGVGNYLKDLIIKSHITSRVKVLELGTSQRCSMHIASKTDIEEAFFLGKSAIHYSRDNVTGKMISIKRTNNTPYNIDTVLVNAHDVANHTKYFPFDWINKNGNHVTSECYNYLKPLINGTPDYILENSLPKFIKLR